MSADPLLEARARVLHDLGARGLDSAAAVDVLEDVVTERRWWVGEWPDGASYVAGQVAQDVQDRLLDGQISRWPRCTACDDTDPHELHIEPELGQDPRWLCEKSGIVVAALGEL
ncbi:MAG TPA: hypothetical protein VFR13_03170 [Jiangellaceae bacterium]|nr:hypothetical protein [Jiangellaceae bacterium]